MQIIIGFLIVGLVVQEIRIHKLIERLLLQANVPQTLGPVRSTPPTETPEAIDTRRKIATVKIPY